MKAYTCRCRHLPVDACLASTSRCFSIYIGFFVSSTDRCFSKGPPAILPYLTNQSCLGGCAGDVCAVLRSGDRTRRDRNEIYAFPRECCRAFPRLCQILPPGVNNWPVSYFAYHSHFTCIPLPLRLICARLIETRDVHSSLLQSNLSKEKALESSNGRGRARGTLRRFTPDGGLRHWGGPCGRPAIKDARGRSSICWRACSLIRANW